jgi:hypothetical protein
MKPALRVALMALATAAAFAGGLLAASGERSAGRPAVAAMAPAADTRPIFAGFSGR